MIRSICTSIRRRMLIVPAVAALAGIALIAPGALAAIPDLSTGAPSAGTSRIAPVPAATWTLLGTVNPQYPWSGNVQMQIYGAYLYTATSVVFNQHSIPVAVRQTVLPFVRVPDGNAHTYKLVFHLRTDSATTSRYQLDHRTPVDAAPGDTILEFIDTVDLEQVSMWSWMLGNVSGDNWVFYSCDIYEQTL